MDWLRYRCIARNESDTASSTCLHCHERIHKMHVLLHGPHPVRPGASGRPLAPAICRPLEKMEATTSSQYNKLSGGSVRRRHGAMEEGWELIQHIPQPTECQLLQPVTFHMLALIVMTFPTFKRRAANRAPPPGHRITPGLTMNLHALRIRPRSHCHASFVSCWLLRPECDAIKCAPIIAMP
ncbi:hypothetical protein BV22DRAFT_3570 [Leucogyrophana mollusca]|uniref:Uncharacterized protein n=1 Tax=Leucogyrophana mollusca TaxID=85980 RepID=A0ACB8C0B0_9AGAM|nr:hypothetical protein BV22DRAFT_3570 [Leucogyrophana mollusca]